MAWPARKPGWGLPSGGDDFCYDWEQTSCLSWIPAFSLDVPASPSLPAVCLRLTDSAELPGTSGPGG